MKNEKGVALVTAIVVVLIEMALAASLATEIQLRHKEQIKRSSRAEAEFIALSGVEITRLVLLEKRSTGWSTLLQQNTNLPLTCPTISNSTILPEGNATDTGTFSFGSIREYSRGSYYVVLRNDNDDSGGALSDTNDQLVVTSTGTSADGTSVQVQVLVYFVPSQFTPNAALTTGGDLKMSGNALITGTNGSVHTNMNLTMSGNANITKVASAVGTIATSGNATAGTFIPNAARVQIPEVDPNAYRSQANYILGADGNVRDPAGNIIFYTFGNSDNKFNGIHFNPGVPEWHISGNHTGAPATYFVEGMFAISGNAQMQATIIAQGSVKISGNGVLTPHLSNTLVVAGGDIKVSGNGLTGTGLYFAREQIKLSGNANITGAMIAQDKWDVDPLVTTTTGVGDQLSGNATITYNGGLASLLTAGSNKVAIKSISRLK